MKRIVSLVAAIALAVPGSVWAKGGNHPQAGCGLGYVLFGHNDNTPVMQILAATTNNIVSPQTFSITTGTFGCTEDGAVKFVKEAEVFAEVNLDSLRREMAMGEGEYVTSFAVLLGAQGDQIPAMVSAFQKNYAVLFPSSSTTSAELMTNLSDALTQKA
jgi:hypothetical protein